MTNQTTNRVTVDYDHDSPDYVKRGHEINHLARQACPVAWSEHHGGFWAVTGYEAIGKAMTDDETFSSEHDVDGTKRGFRGVSIPERSPVCALPLEVDPPESLEYRRAMMRHFTPSAAATWRQYAAEVTHKCIDSVIETGEIDFVHDLTGPVSGKLVLSVVGLPPEDWKELAQPFHDMASFPENSPNVEAIHQKLLEMLQRLAGVVAERRSNPTNDAITDLLNAEVGGAKLTDEQVVNVLLTILGGGFDTTMGLVCHALAWLSDHPNERQRLIDNPSLIPAAGEEFLRYFSPIQSLSRTVGEDTELCGQSLSFGDRVLLSFAGANRDPEAYDHPDEMILARFPNRHVAFGLGTHRCIGSNFARMEVTAMLKGVLERIPDYTAITSEAERYETIGNINGFTRMPASFTPGSRLTR